MKQIAALVTIMMLIFQGISSLALASVSQEELNPVAELITPDKHHKKHGMMHGRKFKEQIPNMHSSKGKKHKMHQFRGGKNRVNCPSCFKERMLEMNKVDKSFSLPYNLGLTYLSKASPLIEKLVLRHDYVMVATNTPKQEYYAPLEKPPKA